MQKFTSLSRKNLLNYVSGWEFCLLFHKYPIIVYINLHNINNNKLHQLKDYMTANRGCAQVLNTHQLEYFFDKNIKFKFLITGNLVALMFEQWSDVWNFKQQNWCVMILTASIQGTFLNLYENSDSDPLDLLQHMLKQNKNVMSKTSMQIGCHNNNLYNCFYQPINATVNNLWLGLLGLAQMIENFSNSIEQFKFNTKNK